MSAPDHAGAMSGLAARLFVWLQRLLPKYLMTALVYRVTRIRHVPTKNFLITRFCRLYDVNVDEIREQVPAGFTTFNDFFVRELAEDARAIDTSAGSIVSPVDGTISAAGRIDGERIFQAKGLDYTLTDLLATDLADAEKFSGGSFATIYLAPYNYHRVHAPLAGRVTSLRYVPGSLFSVNDATVRYLPELFARNERLVCRIATRAAPMILVFVGALHVGSISTPWTGELRPRRRGTVERLRLQDHDHDSKVHKGGLLGWFNMGSTVIVLLPPGNADDFAGLRPGQKVRMGEAIGRIVTAR